MAKWIVPESVSASGASQDTYQRWLLGRAVAHLRRDQKRAGKTGHAPLSRAAYQQAIHDAVVRSDGRCEYTREPLRWDIVGTWDNDHAQRGGSSYKRDFAQMPTIDHVHRDDGVPNALADLRVTSWELNDAKGDLSFDQFVALCRRVIAAAP